MTARRETATFLRLALVVLCIAVAAPAAAVVTSGAAQAQEQQPRQHRFGLFDFLFGRRDRQEAPPPPARQRPAARSAPAGSAPAAPPPPQAVEKLENARPVLVVGDFMAGGLAEGLQDAFAQSPGVRVEVRANGSSGFVRDDFYDWPSQIGGVIEEVKPAVVVVMLGANDRQQLAVNGNRERVRSDAWTAEYTTRVGKLAAAIRQAHVPLLWVGMPSFKPSGMTADMLALNDIYRAAAEQAGGEFVDIWEGFVDDNGAFTSVGPDMNGQRVRLRGSDGINLTVAGKRKVAFYVERPLNKLLGNAVAPGIASLGPTTGPAAGIGMQQPAEIDRTAPISLADPALDGGAALLGAHDPAAEDRKLGTPVEKLVQEGLAPASKPGRADNFAIVPASAEAAAGKTEPAAAATAETTSTIETVSGK